MAGTDKVFDILYKISRKIPVMSRLLRMLYSCDIPRKAKIGQNVTFAHSGLGVVIHQNAIIEENVFIQHHVTIGLRDGTRKCPIIHKNVAIHAYAMILGDVEIGEGSVIGAGSLVMHDVPPNTIYYNKKEEIIRDNVK